ncbi:MAG: hypothetical protein A2902_04375 [Elusimicrobia bacterium RIFCSPLOWO2_01_FULL_64_13]|nr:MAG: hypothetical protein A2902_04375 [Elusimicrobia bacterium RIFCSPLOWO2_01_FULL_64_13]
MKKAIVLLSGGLDSAVCLWWAERKGFRLATLTFTFPGRRARELAATRRLRRLAGSKENYEVHLPFVPPPKAEEACHIPARNLMYYGVAASLAGAVGAGTVVGGHILHDGAVFRDARPEYLAAVEGLARKESRAGRAVRFVFPFIRADKKNVILAGHRLKTPFAATWSCSRNGMKHCWKCGSCRERISGFAMAGLEDPLRG